MPVVEYSGDIFKTNHQTIVCTINVVGVMGKGIALEFRNRFPSVFDYYRERFPYRYSDRDVDPDNELIHQLHVCPIGRDKQCLLFPTKKHWRQPSKLEWVDENLRLLSHRYRELNITSLALPPLGCGNGGLLYRDVQPLIHEHLHPLPIEVTIHC